VRLLDFLFFVSVFSVTFEKVNWEIAGTFSLADLTALAFLGAYALGRLGLRAQRTPRSLVVLGAFLAAFLLVYLAGYFSLDTAAGEQQFVKGLVKWAIHFLFLGAGVALIVRRGEDFYWRTLGWFCGGMVFNSLYGLVQLLFAQAGFNIDSTVLSPLTGGASSINIYGAVNGASVFRPNALTGDPNHLGVFLIIPLLVLTPLYLRLERRHPWRRRLAWTCGFLLIVELATLSRSGLLGVGLGALVLALPYRRPFRSRAFLGPVAVVAGILAVVIASRWEFFSRVLRSRVETGDGSTSAHFGVYDFIPQVFHTNPFFGLGLNNFSVYYEQVTGKTNWGPHSFYVALVVETGLVGTIVFAVFIWYLFRRLRAARAVGRALAAAGAPAASRARPLAWGLTAALVGTMAANAFYLTMPFYYFYVFAMLVVAAPAVFGRRLRSGR
jgi:O-antigen ligase